MIEKIISSVEEKYQDRPERLAHIKGVADTAEALAKLYGIDVKDAQIAAWMHDYTKFDPIEEQVRYLDLKIVKKYADYTMAYHAFSAAALIEIKFDVHNNNIKNAIKHHIWGRPNMSKLEKIILLADKIEPSRSYPGVEKIRALAQVDLNQALLSMMEENIAYLETLGKKIHPEQYEAFNYLKEHMHE